MNGHAFLAPSSAPQWGYCSGSVFAQLNVPDIEHPRTREGTASHWVAAEALNDSAQRDCSAWVGSTAENGVIVNVEMADGAQVYVDRCRSVRRSLSPLGFSLVEQRVHMPRIHEKNWGTLDFAACDFQYRPDGSVGAGLIHLIDYKFGFLPVKAFENLQAVDYVAGLCEMFNIDGRADQHIDVVIEIVQPFNYQAGGPISTWSVKLSDLRPYFNQLAKQAHDAENNPTLTAGQHCRNCKAAHRCDTLKRSNYSVLHFVNQPPTLDDMTPAELATERAILQRGAAMLKARADAIEDQLTHALKQGAQGTGLALETALGNLNWTVEPTLAATVCAQFGVDISKKAILTPTQAIDAAPKEAREALRVAMNTISKRPAKGLKIIKATDSRTAAAFKKV